MGALASLTSAACWACASLLFARLGRQTHPAAMNFLKCSIALLLMMATMVAFGLAPWPLQATSRELGLLTASGLIGLALGDTCYFQALVRLGPRRTLLLAALVPVITTALGTLVLGELPTLRMLAGMALTVGGVVWVVRERQPAAPAPAPAPDASESPESGDRPAPQGSISPSTPGGMTAVERAGLGFAVLAALCQSSGQLLTRSAAADLSTMELSIVRLGAGVVGIAVQLVLLGQVRAVAVPFRSAATAWTLAIATFLGTYCGVWFMNYGLQHAPIGVASTLNSTSPIFILPLSALVLGERVSLRAIAGAVVAVCGIAVLATGAGA